MSEDEVTPTIRKADERSFDSVVEVLGSPVRRNIIQKLSQGPDYTLRLSNELNVSQQLASKHLKVIRNAELVDVIRQASSKGASKNMFTLNKFYSLQIDFSPNLYNERLISFNNPHLWVTADNYMDRLEDQVQDISEEESGVDKVNPLGQIISAVDEELDSLEKRRARLLYIRNLAMNASHGAVEELDRRKRQIIHQVLDKGPASIDSLSRVMQLREQTVKDLVKELEAEGLVSRMGGMVYLTELI